MKTSKSAQKAIDNAAATIAPVVAPIAPIGTKPSKETIKKAVVPALVMIAYHVPSKGNKSGYKVFSGPGSKMDFLGYTHAAAIATGCLTIGGGKGNGKLSHFTDICGATSSMKDYWKNDKKWIDDKSITGDGQKEFSARIVRGATTLDIVKALLVGIQKGGKVKSPTGFEYDFTSVVSLSK